MQQQFPQLRCLSDMAQGAEQQRECNQTLGLDRLPTELLLLVLSFLPALPRYLPPLYEDDHLALCRVNRLLRAKLWSAWLQDAELAVPRGSPKHQQPYVASITSDRWADLGSISVTTPDCFFRLIVEDGRVVARELYILPQHHQPKHSELLTLESIAKHVFCQTIERHATTDNDGFDWVTVFACIGHIDAVIQNWLYTDSFTITSARAWMLRSVNAPWNLKRRRERKHEPHRRRCLILRFLARLSSTAARDDNPRKFAKR